MARSASSSAGEGAGSGGPASAAAAAAAAAAGGLLHLGASRVPSRRPSAGAAPRLRGASCARGRQPRRRAPPPLAVAAAEEAYTGAETELLDALAGVQGRGRGVAPRQLEASMERTRCLLKCLCGVADISSCYVCAGGGERCSGSGSTGRFARSGGCTVPFLFICIV